MWNKGWILFPFFVLFFYFPSSLVLLGFSSIQPGLVSLPGLKNRRRYKRMVHHHQAEESTDLSTYGKDCEWSRFTSVWGQKLGTLGSTIPVITVPTSLKFKNGFGFILIERVISYPASRASSLFISSTGFIASHLARSACAEKYERV